MVAVSSTITLLLTGFQLYRDYNLDPNLINFRQWQIDEVHLKSINNALWATDASELQILLDGILNTPDLQYIVVTEDEIVWAAAGKEQLKNVVNG